MKRLTLRASEVNAALDNGEFPDELMTFIENYIMAAQESPGSTDDAELVLVLTNDFEPDEDEEESEDDDEESEDKPATETKE